MTSVVLYNPITPPQIEGALEGGEGSVGGGKSPHLRYKIYQF